MAFEICYHLNDIEFCPFLLISNKILWLIRKEKKRILNDTYAEIYSTKHFIMSYYKTNFFLNNNINSRSK